jgi:hypothetical protein
MTISAVTNAAAAYQPQVQHQHRRPEPSLDNTAKLLGVSADDLRTQLKSGTTLDDLATAKGVSSSDLLTAVKSDLKANKPADAPELSDDQLTQMATDIAAGKRPERPAGPPPARQDTGARLEDLADTLGVSQEDLLNALRNGAKVDATAVDGGVAVDTYA